MTAIKVSPSEPMVRRIVQATYPSYRGRKVSIVPQHCPLNVRSYWEGGSRDYFVFLRLDTFAVASMPAQSAFDKPVTGADAVTLPAESFALSTRFFAGKIVAFGFM